MDGKHKLLFIDDDPDITFILRTVLKNKQYEITTINDPTKIWGELEKSQYDLLIVDYLMPEIDGLELSEKIRKSSDPKIRDMKVFLLTAKKLDEDDFRRIKELKLKYEPKPIHPEVFSYRLRSYIEDN